MDAIIEAFYSVFNVFTCCELGERLTIAYDGLECEIEQFEWFAFPIEIQRILPIIMNSGQQTVTLQYFGSFCGDRETFKKANNSTEGKSKMKNNSILFFDWCSF